MVSSAEEAQSGAVYQALEDARKQLLDLTFRNNFLNYRVLRARGLEVSDDSAERIADLIMNGSGAFRFITQSEAKTRREAWLRRRASGSAAQAAARQALGTGSEDDASSAAEDAENASLAVISPHQLREGLNDYVLITPHEPAELEARLLNTLRFARSFVEERGVNTLFLALGTLHWTESSSSSTFRESPLFLIPIVLERANVEHDVRLRYDDGDVQGNPTLHERLKQDGIDLPLPEDNVSLSDYLRAVEIAVAGKRGWRVDSSHVSVGFFSFTRYMMYLDLDAANWPDPAAILEHPIIEGALGEGFAAEESLFDENAPLDGQPAYDEVHHIMEADSSQTQAIVEAFARTALVIQGPPGTGKSQTIANLLGEAIARGKRVLFVAEKNAALEVVKRRLDSVGLGSAVMELHSDKATRSSVIKDLRETAELGKPKPASGTADLPRLLRLRRQLNDYAAALHEPIGSTGASPFQLMGRSAKHASVELLDLPALGIAVNSSWTAEQLGELLEISREIEAWSELNGAPMDHPYHGVRIEVNPPSLAARWPGMLEEGLSRTDLAAGFYAGSVAAALEMKPGNLDDLVESISFAEQLHGVLAAAPQLFHDSAVWLSERDQLREATAAARSILEVKKEAEGIIAESAWAETVDMPGELREVLHALTRRNDFLYRWFSAEYRTAAARAALWLDDPATQKQHRHLVSVTRALVRHAEAKAQLYQLQEVLNGVLPPGNSLPMTAGLIDTIEALCGLYDRHSEKMLPRRVSELARLSPDSIERELEEASEANAAAQDSLSVIVEALKLDTSAIFGTGSLGSVNFQEIRSLLTSWRKDIPGLNAGVAWRRLCARAEQAGLNGLVQALMQGQIEPFGLENRLRLSAEAIWLDEAFRARSALAVFDAAEHSRTISDFQVLDKKKLTVNRNLVAARHHAGLPQLVAHGQTGILLQEFNRKRRHRPVRTLMKEAGNAIQALKPVFMMSPLSVSVFLPPGAIEFDLVVFDEASQVRPADALGALLRGSSAVVVGDDKQLPPTSFFDSLFDGADDETEGMAVTDVESVLGLFGARGAKQLMLNWHYRSRHESLIAVSNQEFYENRLLLFPSPDVGRQNAGIYLHHLPDAYYDRGGTRTNPDEARAIAAAVLVHAQTSPEKSLGVATFSSAQASAVEREVTVLAREHPVLDSFMRLHPNEPFFVKNLETVQGDERDVIYISVGYGKSADGRFTYNFGPLNREGGERRLNVIVTRARERTEVFANFTDEDLDPARINAFGVQVLRTYLGFARTGVLELPELADRDDESPFEDAVFKALVRRGHQVRRQVGQAGYFIDLAIADPEKPGRMILGIECDGATYHSSRSARERDRLRQAVLENLGWRIHRIWSTDWFRDPEGCMNQVETAIAEAHEAARSHQTEQKSAEVESIPREQKAAAVIERAAPVAITATQLTAPEYEVSSLTPINLQGELADQPIPLVASWLNEVIMAEGPIHADDAFRRTLTRAGIQRMGSRIRSTFNAAVQHGIATNLFSAHENALVTAGYDITTVKPRDRSRLEARERNFSRVPNMEVDAAVLAVVRAAHGMQRSEIPPAVVLLLGFGRASQNIQQAIEQRISRLLEQQLLVADSTATDTLSAAS